MKIVLRHIILLSVYTALGYVLFSLFSVGTGLMLQGAWQLQTSLILTLILMSIYADPVTKKVTRFVADYLPDTTINYQRFLKNFSNAVVTIVDLEKLTKIIVNTLYDFYELTGVSLMLLDKKKRSYVTVATAGGAGEEHSVDREHILVQYLEEHPHMVIAKSLPQGRQTNEVRTILKELQSELCIPLSFKNNLIGILHLGRKRSGSHYSPEDADAFFTLESQIALAINNAILFKNQREAHVLLAQKNKMDAIIALSSGINHEINNPLSIISMRCQNFLRKLAMGKFLSAAAVIQSAQEVIESSLRNANRAHLITQRLAKFAKPSQEELHFEPVKIKDCIQECIELIGKKRLHGDDITIHITVPDGIPDIYADKVHFQQVLYNMVMNAYHAIRRNGTITFRVHAEGNRKVVLEIEDTGSGIAPEIIDKIWEPFFTTKPTNPLPGDMITGSGLGLALVRQYIENSGGHVEVASTPGKGTIFSVTLLRALDTMEGHSNEKNTDRG